MHVYSECVGEKHDTIRLGEFKQLSTSSSYEGIATGSRELAGVDLSLLQTNEAKCCFFANVYNLLFVHAMLLAVQASRPVPRLDESSLESMLLLQTIQYSVGQLGNVRYLALQ